MQKRLTLNEMAERLHLTPKTFRKYVIDLQIPHLLLGSNMRFDPDAVERYLTARAEPKQERAAVVPFKAKKPKSKQITFESRCSEALGVH